MTTQQTDSLAPIAWSGAIAVTRLGDDFASAVPATDRELADRAGRLPLLTLDAGQWTPPDVEERPRGVIILAGALLREVRLAGRQFAQLVDGGEALDPWHDHEGSVPAVTSWTALEPVTMAVLDRRFERIASRWPDVLSVLQRRTAEQATRTAVHGAILSLPTVELRVLALLWHLADRRGTVSADGVTVRLPVTHEQIGALCAARRSTATLALTDLTRRGHLVRQGGGRWLLSHRSRELLQHAPA